MVEEQAGVWWGLLVRQTIITCPVKQWVAAVRSTHVGNTCVDPPACLPPS